MTLENRRSLPEALNHLRLNSIRTDVRFVFPHEPSSPPLEAHRFLLAARSTVFETMFYGSMPEGEEVKIDDTEREIYDDMLRFIYTDDIPLNEDTVMKLLHLAHRYQITTLVDFCAVFLQDELVDGNACFIFNQASLFEIIQLRKSSLTFIEQNTSKVIESDGWLELPLTDVSAILDSDKHTVEEHEIFWAVLKWAGKQCELHDLPDTGKNKRTILGDAFYKVRISTMPVEEYFTHVLDSDVLSREEKEKLCSFFTSQTKCTLTLPYIARERTGKEYKLPIENISLGPVPFLVQNMHIELTLKSDVAMKLVKVEVENKLIQSMSNCTAENTLQLAIHYLSGTSISKVDRTDSTVPVQHQKLKPNEENKLHLFFALKDCFECAGLGYRRHCFCGGVVDFERLMCSSCSTHTDWDVMCCLSCVYHTIKDVMTVRGGVVDIVKGVYFEVKYSGPNLLKGLIFKKY